MATAAETILEGGPMSIRQVIRENARLRSAISLAIGWLDLINGDPEQDIEKAVAYVRADLELALSDGERIDDTPPRG